MVTITHTAGPETIQTPFRVRRLAIPTAAPSLPTSRALYHLNYVPPPNRFGRMMLRTIRSRTNKFIEGSGMEAWIWVAVERTLVFRLVLAPP